MYQSLKYRQTTLIKTPQSYLRKMSLIPRLLGSKALWDPLSADDLWSASNEPAARVQVDWKETPEAHIVKADLPGLKKEEVKVEVQDNRVLEISGERAAEQEDKNDKWHRVERSKGKFIRRFWFPENAKLDEVKASMDNGVLTVTVPKKEVKKPEVKTVEITGN